MVGAVLDSVAVHAVIWDSIIIIVILITVDAAAENLP